MDAGGRAMHGVIAEIPLTPPVDPSTAAVYCSEMTSLMFAMRLAD